MSTVRGITKGALRTVAAAAVVLVAGATLASAQPGHRGGFGGRGPGGGPDSPLHVAALRGLDLTEAQREQVRGIVTSHREEAQAVHTRNQAAMRALQEATLGTDEALIRQRGEAVGAAITEGAVLRSKVHAEVWAVLTPEQQAKAEQLRAERKAQMAQRQQRMQQRQQERGTRGGQRQG